MPSPVRALLVASCAASPLLTTSIASAAPQSAAAPPRAAEVIVVTASTVPASIDVLGRAVVVLTRDELQQLGIASPVDALRLVPGVDVRARGPFGIQADLSMRGATFGQQLVLFDGLRLNDAQSGHHNAEVPLPIGAIDRVEVVQGPGSSVHGADALGGAVNVVPRRDGHSALEVAAGQFGFASAQLSAGGGWLPRPVALVLWASRSGDFDVPQAAGGSVRSFDRETAQGGAALRFSPRPGLTFAVHHQRRAFGANQFYGNSPSKEWTDQTLGAFTWRGSARSWTAETRVAARNHGDHFRWDIARPGFAENRHRTNAVDVSFTLHRAIGGQRQISIGGGAGGDRVASSNLGDHGYARGHGFVELLAALGPRATLQAGLRVDRYSTFGTAWNPAAGLAVAIAPSVRVRGSVARAFRVPTFTELYYTDPANLGSDDLTSEHGWAADAGVDVRRGAWTLSATTFGHWDTDVIDWVREQPADLWRSTNVRDVLTRGVEAAATGRWTAAIVRVAFSAQSVDAPALNLLSKYVLEYARYSTAVAAAAPVGFGFRAAVTADRRVRHDGQRYTLVNARLSRPLGRADLFVSGANLLDEAYREIAGVDLPGRWLMAGIAIR